MLTYPTVARPTRRTLAFALPLVLLIAACGAAAAPPASTAPTAAPPTPKPTPTAVPGELPSNSDPINGGNTGGGVDPGEPGKGGGIVFPIPLPPNPNDNPFLGEATVVAPNPGRLNPHPVSVGFLRAAVAGDGSVVAELRWYSGLEECSATDSVQVVKDDAAKTIKLTVMEGTNPGDMVCIDIAVLKATVVDLDVLAPGTWTISAEGEAPPIKLEVG